MALLRLSDAELHFGTQVLLDKLNLTISKGERLGLLGRNGVGKTTLFKVLTGEQQLDDGERWIDPGVKLSRLEQELPLEDKHRSLTGSLAVWPMWVSCSLSTERCYLQAMTTR